MNYKVDPAIIGGMVVSIGDKFADMSIASKMKKYTDLALRKDFENSKLVCDSLDTVRQAFHSSKPQGKPHAHQKYWQELLGQVGGRTRFPNLELTNDEKKKINKAFEASGLIK